MADWDPRYSLIAFAILCRRQAGVVFELAHEVNVVVIAALLGDGRHRDLRGGQEKLRMGHPALENIIADALTEQHFVGMLEVGAADIGHAGHFIDGHVEGMGAEDLLTYGSE